MSEFFAGSERPALIEIYREWRRHNRAAHCRWSIVLTLVFSALLILIDIGLFGERFTSYAGFRVGLIIFASLTAVAFQLTLDQAHGKTRNFLIGAIQTSLGVAWHTIYCFFLLRAAHEAPFHQDLLIVTGATMLLIIAITMWGKNFWEEQYVFTGVGMAGLFVSYMIDPSISRECLLISCAHIVGLGFAFVERRRFASQLFHKHRDLVSVLPRDIANHMVLSDSESIAQAFKPTRRMTTTLICDIRSYQRLMASMNPDDMSQLFESYYDTIMESLAFLVPSGEYYATWTADELFVSFFSAEEENDYLTPVQNALTFSAYLCGPAFDEIRTNLGRSLLYDVGLATGSCLVGLQGPKSMKKTTVVGEAPGVAKRLEAQAKDLRESLPTTLNANRPIAALDETTFRIAGEVNFRSVEYATSISPTVRDIPGEKVFVWQPANATAPQSDPSGAPSNSAA